MDTIKADEKLIKPVREIFIERLNRGSSIRIVIKGRSMYPFIKRGDILTVKPIKFEQTKIGDMVVYTRSIEHDFTVHRLIRKRKDSEGKEYLFTKGDANIYGDGPVYPADVYGKVVSIKRRYGMIINLETKFNGLFAYPVTYLFWAWAILKEAIIYPPNFLKRVRKKVQKYFFT